MELKVWVEGIQRIVCGVSDTTTCQDVVYALAHATGKTGRFTLIERWRNNERLLAPHENPLKILMKWGEYSNDVQFILQRSALDTKSSTQQQQQQQHSVSSRTPASTAHNTQNRDVPPSSCRPYGGVSAAEAAPRHSPQSHLKKSLTFSGGGAHADQGVGGVPYKISHHHQHHRHRGAEISTATHNKNINNTVTTSPTRHASPTRHVSPSRRHTSSSPTRHASASPTRHASPTRGGIYGRTRSPTKSYEDEQHTRNAANRPMQPRQSQETMEGEALVKDDSSAITSNGSIKANAHILKEGHEPNSKENTINNLRDLSHGSGGNIPLGYTSHGGEQNNNKENNLVVDGRYQDLIRLINLQRDKLNLQHVQMTKHEAEIVYLEGRTREDETRLNYVAQEIERHGELVQQLDQEVLALQELENEMESVRGVEADIKAQLGSLEAKLQHTEAQLSHHNSKIQELKDDACNEEARSSEESRKQEDAMIREIDKLKRSIAEATQQADHATHTSQCLMQEMSEVEALIGSKKKEVENLVVEMKDANLASLSMTLLPSPASADDTHDTGLSKGGSSRRMVGSPRQLENAVPTSKNPHGVWV